MQLTSFVVWVFRRWAACSQDRYLNCCGTVYGTVIQLARLSWRIRGLKITVTGVDNHQPAAAPSSRSTTPTTSTSPLRSFARLAEASGAGAVPWPSRRCSITVTGPIMRLLHRWIGGTRVRPTTPPSSAEGRRAWSACTPRRHQPQLREIKEFKTEGTARQAEVPIVPLLFGVQRGSGPEPSRLFRPRCQSRCRR